MNENQDLVDAIRDLTAELRRYRKVKERGIDLAEEIEAQKRSWVLEVDR